MTVGAVVVAMLMTGAMTAAAQAAGAGSSRTAPVTTPDEEQQHHRPAPTEEPDPTDEEPVERLQDEPEDPDEPPAPPAPGAAGQPPGYETSAARLFGWGEPNNVDDFDGDDLGPDWKVYDGPGHVGNGRRSPSAVDVSDGIMTITGDSDGTTAGMAWDPGQKYGRWEGRVQVPVGDDQYHALLLLWPDAENWPVGGEVDFMEIMDGERDGAEMFLHYGRDNSQVSDSVEIDATQWHNWAVEWTPDRIVAYVDGEEWFRSTDKKTLPPGPMHLCIQLDWFPGGGDPEESEMRVDWVRQYPLTAASEPAPRPTPTTTRAPAPTTTAPAPTTTAPTTTAPTTTVPAPTTTVPTTTVPAPTTTVPAPVVPTTVPVPTSLPVPTTQPVPTGLPVPPSLPVPTGAAPPPAAVVPTTTAPAAPPAPLTGDEAIAQVRARLDQVMADLRTLLLAYLIASGFGR